MFGNRLLVMLAVLAACFFCSTSMGTAEPAPQASPAAAPTPRPSPKKPRFHFDLDARFMPENFDYFAPNGNFQNAYTFLGVRIRPGLTYEGKDWMIYGQAQGTFLLGLPTRGNAPAPAGALGQGASYYAFALAPDSGSIGIRQLFARLGSAGGTSVQVGRFDYNSGMETLTGDPVLDYVKTFRISKVIMGVPDYNTWARSFDGVRADVDTGPVHLTGLVCQPTQIEPHFGTNVPNVTNMNFALTFKDGFVPHGEAQLFFNQANDTRFVAQVDNAPVRSVINPDGGDKISTFGGYYVSRLGRDGDASVLYARQTGKWGQQTQDAYAFIGELGLRFPDTTWKPWVRAGYRIFSGDSNPFDNRHQSFQAIVADSRVRYNIYTNVNIQEVFGELLVYPSKKETVRLDLRTFALDQPADLWYSGNGVAQNKGANGFSGRPSGGNREVGTLLEAIYENKINQNNLLRLQDAYAWGGKVVSTSYPQQVHGHQFYVEYHYIIP